MLENKMRLVTSFKTHFPTFTDRANLPLYYLLGVLICYAVLSRFLYGAFVPHFGGYRFVPAYIAVALVALAGVQIGYAGATPAYRILLRSIIGFSLFYVVTSRVAITDELIAGSRLSHFELNQAWILAAACGLVGLFRPSFAFVTFQYMVWQKRQLIDVFGLNVEWLDYFTVIESGNILIVGYLIYAALRRTGVLDTPPSGDGTAASEEDSKHTALHPADMLVLLTVALHFGNYLYAGLIKGYLGDDPTFWFRENPTHWLILAALESKVLPISFSDGLTAFSYETILKVAPVTNFITIAMQLFALVAVIRIRWVIYLTLFYDLMHVMIFVLTGIFFWKFILLNLAIVAALVTLRHRAMSSPLQGFLALVVVISPFVFHIFPSFAWLDSRSMNVVRLYAVTDDGKELQVPSNYFLGLSVTFTQNRLVWPKEGPVTTESWGVAKSMEQMRRSLACDWGYDRGELPKARFGVSKEQISYVIRRYHKQMLSMLDAEGNFAYDLFPHHIFSMPWYFDAFRVLDKRQITAYRYENESLCLGFEDGKPRHRRLWYGTFDIPLD